MLADTDACTLGKAGPCLAWEAVLAQHRPAHARVVAPCVTARQPATAMWLLPQQMAARPRTGPCSVAQPVPTKQRQRTPRDMQRDAHAAAAKRRGARMASLAKYATPRRAQTLIGTAPLAKPATP